MKFKKPIEVQAGISDGDPTNPLGQAGYLLSSDGSNVNWVSPGGLSAETAEAIVQPIKADEALAKGDPLYIVGYQTGQDVNIVAKADSSLPAKMPVVGLADADYASQAFGTMTAFGSFNGSFDTTGPGTESWALGDIIFVKPGGGLTNIRPGGTDLIQNVAIVSRVQQNTGELEVIALGRTNDVPNLPEGRLFVGTATNTSLASDVVYVDDANGRLGIGTNIPLGAIQVGDGAAASPSTNQILVLSNTATTGGNSNLYLATGASGTSTIGMGGTQFSVTNTAGKITYTDSSDTFSFNTNFSTKMVINSSGNVGIGTTLPSERLVVRNGTSNTDVKILAYNSAAGTEATLKFSTIASETNYEKAAIIARNPDGSWGRSDMHFALDSGEDSGNVEFSDTKMTILNGGNVGIGTTDPDVRLHVDGGGGILVNNAGGDTVLSANSNTGIFSIGDTGELGDGVYATNTQTSYFDIYGGGGVKFRMDVNGNVGIGTTNPTAKTHIEQTIGNGTIAYPLKVDVMPPSSSASGDGTGISFGVGNNGSNRREQARITVKQNYYGVRPSMSFDTTDYNSPYTNFISRMLIDPEGNVGIGTTNPAKKVTIGNIGAGNTDGLKIEDPGNTAYGAHYSYNDASSTVEIGGVTNNVLNDCVSIARDATRTITINTSEEVGIGNTNPQAKLHVQDYTTGESHQAMFKGGSVDIGDYSYISLNGGYAADYGKEVRLAAVSESTFGNKTGFAVLTSPDSGGASGHERLRVTADGDVGIGTNDPSEKLDVEGNVKANNYINQRVAWNSGFRHDGNTATSYYFIPVGYISEITGDTYYNNWIAPYAGRVRKIVLRNTGQATVPTATTVNFRVSVNGSVVHEGSTITVTGSGLNILASETLSDTDAVFSATDRVQVAYRTDGLWRNTAAGISLEYTE
jgi:hypothetical protein